MVFVSSAVAQVSTTGRLSGTVADQNGAVVAGATVVLKDNATNQEFKATTNSEGTFLIPSLGNSTYTATVNAKGFKQTVVTEVKVDAGKASNIAVTLEVGAASESVTVTGGGELVQSQSANINTTLIGRQITDIPTASRDALDLVLTMPGAQTPGRPRSTTVNGLPKGALNITIDGLNVQDNLLKSSDGFFTFIRPRTDAVEEVTVSTSNPGAESAAEGAVQIKFVTKGGTNEYHGGLYWYHRNPSLNSNYWFTNATVAADPRTGAAPRARVLLNQPGGKIGGPIRIPKLFDGRDRAFFFVNYEEFRLPEATLRTRTVLTPEAQSGIFSYLTSSGERRTVNLLGLAGSRGVTSTIDPTVGSVLNEIRGAISGLATTPSSVSPNYETVSFINTGLQIRKFPTVRLDVNITKKHHIENVWNYQQFRSNVDFLNNVDPAFPGLPNFGSQDSNRWSNSIALRSTLTPTIVNEARFGLTGGITLFRPQLSVAQFENQRGFFLGISAAGITNAGVTESLSRRNTPIKQFTDNLTWVKGSHNLVFGGSYTRINSFISSLNNVVQTITFGIAEQDRDAFALFDTAGQGRANFPGAPDAEITRARNIYATLVGRVTGVNGTAFQDENTGKFTYNGDFTQRSEQSEFGFFVQDTWRARPNITLTGGLRYEVQMPFVNKNINYSFNTLGDLTGVSGIGNIFTPGAGAGSAPLYREMPPGTQAYETDWLNLAPSIGFSYSPQFDGGILKRLFGEGGQTVLRGGFSVAFVREGINTFQSINGSNPGGSLNTPRSVALGNLEAGTLLRDGSPNSGPFAPPPFSETISYPFSPVPGTDSVNAFLPSIDLGYVESWSFGLQRELTKDTVFEARYVGNRGHRLWRQYDINEVNTIENGFLQEFKLAQSNLMANIAAGRGANFRYFGPGTGTNPLPILLAHFTGLPASEATNPVRYAAPTAGNAFFARAAFVTNLNPLAPSVLGFAGALADRANYTNASFPYHPNALKAGLPHNFWVINPDADGSFIIDNGQQTWYDGLTFEVRRRMSQGLLLQANYTFAKSLSNFWGSDSVVFNQYASLRNPRGAKVESPFNITHGFKANFIYELPVGRGRALFSNISGVGDRIVGGWGINGSIRLQSGTAFSLGHLQVVGMSVDQLQDLVKVRKNVHTDPFTGQTVRGLVFYLPQDVIENTRKAFNTAIGASGPSYTFGAPSGRFLAPASFGNCLEGFSGQCGSDRVILHGPRFTRFDLSLVKRTRISETMNLEVRGEFLNAFNHTNFIVGNAANDVNAAASIGGTAFGRLTEAYRDTSTTNDPGGRLVQLVVRFNF
jgi:hypothetical protein